MYSGASTHPPTVSLRPPETSVGVPTQVLSRYRRDRQGTRTLTPQRGLHPWSLPVSRPRVYRCRKVNDPLVSQVRPAQLENPTQTRKRTCDYFHFGRSFFIWVRATTTEGRVRCGRRPPRRGVLDDLRDSGSGDPGTQRSFDTPKSPTSFSLLQDRKPDPALRNSGTR